MKGLRLYLSPFAPDSSGASAVLYPLGGLLVICDAGGCAGNICGFDEPRWFSEKSAMFSAGLRDMDAILGRDDRLIDKLTRAAFKIDANFAALIGTPVPAVIATDYRALKRLAEKKLQLPVLAISTDGTHLYDEGAAEAYQALFQTFALNKPAKIMPAAIGVLGAIPLDLTWTNAGAKLHQILSAQGWQTIRCYGLDQNLESIRQAATNTMNLVLSPAGLSAAQSLKKRFGTPYKVWDPLAESELKQLYGANPSFQPEGKRILLLHQQFKANTLRTLLRQTTTAANITVASWFRMEQDYQEEQDCHLTEEDDFQALVQHGDYDYIIGDPHFLRAIPFFTGTFLELPHFAVSGKIGIANTAEI